MMLSALKRASNSSIWVFSDEFIHEVPTCYLSLEPMFQLNTIKRTKA